MNWAEFAVELRESQIPAMADLLAGITPAELSALQSNLRCAAQHLSYSSASGGFFGESGKYDAFETILQ
eukprot:365169-Chlamydomonas_euryale.AAC.1